MGGGPPHDNMAQGCPHCNRKSRFKSHEYFCGRAAARRAESTVDGQSSTNPPASITSSPSLAGGFRTNRYKTLEHATRNTTRNASEIFPEFSGVARPTTPTEPREFSKDLGLDAIGLGAFGLNAPPPFPSPSLNSVAPIQLDKDLGLDAIGLDAPEPSPSSSVNFVAPALTSEESAFLHRRLREHVHIGPYNVPSGSSAAPVGFTIADLAALDTNITDKDETVKKDTDSDPEKVVKHKSKYHIPPSTCGSFCSDDSHLDAEVLRSSMFSNISLESKDMKVTLKVEAKNQGSQQSVVLPKEEWEVIEPDEFKDTPIPSARNGVKFSIWGWMGRK